MADEIQLIEGSELAKCNRIPAMMGFETVGGGFHLRLVSVHANSTLVEARRCGEALVEVRAHLEKLDAAPDVKGGVQDALAILGDMNVSAPDLES